MCKVITAVVIVGLGAALLAGCSGSRSESGSSWFADTNWGSRDKPFKDQNAAVMTEESESDKISNNQWGSGMGAIVDSSTYDADVLAAVHDLNDGKLAFTRMNAATRIGELRPTSNLAIEALEHGAKDSCMDVRMASALALERIGTDNALHHLTELRRNGYVPAEGVIVLGTPAAAACYKSEPQPSCGSITTEQPCPPPKPEPVCPAPKKVEPACPVRGPGAGATEQPVCPPVKKAEPACPPVKKVEPKKAEPACPPAKPAKKEHKPTCPPACPPGCVPATQPAAVY